MHTLRYAALAICLLCCGAPISAAYADLADQINAAVPLSVDAQAALTDMRRRVTNKTAEAAIESQLKLKMQLRALTCAQSLNIMANLSSQEIHDSFGGSPCFAQQDDGIAGWLGLRTVGYLITLPPLRPMPVVGPESITDPTGAISRVYFADQAGVVAIQSTKDMEVIDLNSGNPISTQLQLDGPLLGISPNGRVYISQDNRRNGRLRLFDSQDASLIANPLWEGYSFNFTWLDEQTTLTRDPSSHDVVLYDFPSASTVPLQGASPYGFSVVPIPGSNGSFLETAQTGISEFKLTHGADGKPQAQPVKQPGPAEQAEIRQTSYGTGGILAGGQRYAYVSNNQLAITYLDDMHTEPVDFGVGFEVQTVVPTPDPDKVIVGGVAKHAPGVTRGAWESWKLNAYSLKDQTLTPLADERDLAGHQMGTMFFYDAPLNTLYTQKDSAKDTTLLRMDGLTGDTPIPLATFVADMCGPHPDDDMATGGKRRHHSNNFSNGCPSQSTPGAPTPQYNVNALPAGSMAVVMQNGQMTRVYKGTYQQPGSAAPAPSEVANLPPGTVAMSTAGGEVNTVYINPSAQPAPGNFIQLAQDADVQGIGIAEADMSDTGAPAATSVTASAAGAKVVRVRVKSRARPLILVLSSRSVVQWQLDAGSSSRLAAVLISGPNGSAVAGQGGVPVSIIGNAYSYAMGSPGYAALQNEVFAATGKRMSLFQGGGINTLFNIY